MRSYRATLWVAALLSGVLLAGCGPAASGGQSAASAAGTAVGGGQRPADPAGGSGQSAADSAAASSSFFAGRDPRNPCNALTVSQARAVTGDDAVAPYKPGQGQNILCTWADPTQPESATTSVVFGNAPPQTNPNWCVDTNQGYVQGVQPVVAVPDLGQKACYQAANVFPGAHGGGTLQWHSRNGAYYSLTVILTHEDKGVADRMVTLGRQIDAKLK